MSDSLISCAKCLRTGCQCEKARPTLFSVDDRKENNQAQPMHELMDEMVRANVNQENRTQENSVSPEYNHLQNPVKSEIKNDLKPENDSPNSSNQSRQDYLSDSSDPYADCDERPKTTNRQQESTNPSLNQENGETLSKNEATNPSNSSEESSESCADDNEEKSPADGKKKVRKSKQQKRDKRQKKSNQIPSVTDQEMQNWTSKTPEDCDDENEWIIAGNKKIKNKNRLKPIVDLRDSKFSSKYNIHFHVFVPPEFNIDSIEYEFGLITSLNEFDPKQMHSFQSKPLETGGFIVTGTLSLQNTVREFEYKYVLRIKEDDTHIIEFLGKNNRGPVNRSFRKNDYLVDNQQYDGIMLPPDQETETSNVSKFWKKFTRKIFGGKYYDKEMLKKYEDKTIRVMLKQVIDLKTLDTIGDSVDFLVKISNLQKSDEKGQEKRAKKPSSTQEP